MDREWVDEDYEMGSESEESREGSESEEEIEKEIAELRKGDVEVPEGWKEWRSEKCEDGNVCGGVGGFGNG